MIDQSVSFIYTMRLKTAFQIASLEALSITSIYSRIIQSILNTTVLT